MKKPLEVLPSEYHSRLTLNRENIFDDNSYLSKSALWELYQGSLYKWRFYPKQHLANDAVAWGSLIDCLTTSPDDFDECFVVKPDTYINNKGEVKPWNGNANVCKKLLANVDEGKTIITQEMIENATLAVKNLTETHKESAKIFANSDKQVILLSEVMGVKFKGLVDLAPRGEKYLADLKTTGKFSHDSFEKTTGSLGYHVQAGLYLMLWNTCFPNDQRDRFRIIWQESSPPYEVAVKELTALDIADGQDLGKHLIIKLVNAAKKNYWPMKFEKVTMQSRAAFAGMQEAQEMEGYAEAP